MAESRTNAIRKRRSATFSSFLPASVSSFRIDKNDNTALVIKRIDAIPVSSSMRVMLLYFVAFSEVRMIKQKPSIFDEVLSIWLERDCGMVNWFAFKFNRFKSSITFA